MGLIICLSLMLIGAGEVIYAVFQIAGHGWGFLALGLFTMGFGFTGIRGNFK